MKIDRTSSTEGIPLQADWFEGAGTRQDVARFPQPAGAATVVHFEPGSRTHWHSHADGQVIFVLDGVGRTATRSEPEVTISPGDVVYVEPGEEHWHGATRGDSMRHVALSFGTTNWLEDVEDQANDVD